MEAFERETLTQLARIEEAIKNLVERISNHEVTCREEKSRMWEELRKQSEEIARKIEDKISEIKSESFDNVESVEEKIAEIQETVSDWESRITTIERDIQGSEVISKNINDVVSDKISTIEKKLEQINDININMEGIKTKLDAVSTTVKDLKGDKKYTFTTALTVIAIIIAALSLMANTISKYFQPKAETKIISTD